MDDWEHGSVYSVTSDPKRAKQVLKRKPRDTTRALTDCKVIRPDGSVVPFKTPQQRRSSAQRNASRASARLMAHYNQTRDRQQAAIRIGTIHDENN